MTKEGLMNLLRPEVIPYVLTDAANFVLYDEGL